jgi:hypothetical protein
VIPPFAVTVDGSDFPESYCKNAEESNRSVSVETTAVTAVFANGKLDVTISRTYAIRDGIRESTHDVWR